MNITEFRQQYPEYDSIGDEELSKALHQKYYGTVPYETFKEKFNPQISTAEHVAGKFTGALSQAASGQLERMAIGSASNALSQEADLARIAESSGNPEFLKSYRTELQQKSVPEENPLYKAGQWVRDKAEGLFRTDQKQDQSFLKSTLPSAFGSAAGNIVPSLLAGRYLAGAGSAAGPGLVSSLLGANTEIAEGYREARKAGYDPQQAMALAPQYGAVGATEGLPLSALLAGLERVPGGKLAKIGVGLGIEALSEGAQEGLQTIGENYIAQQSFDPKRQLSEGVGEAAGAGAIVGAVIGGGGGMLSRSKKEGSSGITADDFVTEQAVQPPVEKPIASFSGEIPASPEAIRSELQQLRAARRSPEFSGANATELTQRETELEAALSSYQQRSDTNVVAEAIREDQTQFGRSTGENLQRTEPIQASETTALWRQLKHENRAAFDPAGELTKQEQQVQAVWRGGPRGQVQFNESEGLTPTQQPAGEARRPSSYASQSVMGQQQAQEGLQREILTAVHETPLERILALKLDSKAEAQAAAELTQRAHGVSLYPVSVLGGKFQLRYAPPVEQTQQASPVSGPSEPQVGGAARLPGALKTQVQSQPESQLPTLGALRERNAVRPVPSLRENITQAVAEPTAQAEQSSLRDKITQAESFPQQAIPQLSKTYGSKLSAGRDVSMLRKQFPEKQFYVAEGRGAWIIREGEPPAKVVRQKLSAKEQAAREAEAFLGEREDAEDIGSGKKRGPEGTDYTFKLYSFNPFASTNSPDEHLSGIVKAAKSIDADFESVPGGGLGSRTAQTYRKYAMLPQWLAKANEQFRPFKQIAAERSYNYEQAFNARMKGFHDTWVALSKEQQGVAVDHLKAVEGKRLKATPSPEILEDRVEDLRLVRVNEQHFQEYAAFLQSKGYAPEVQAFLNTWKRSYAEGFAEWFNSHAKDSTVDRTMLEDMLQNVGHVPNYFPHMWYGNYYVDGLDKDGKVVARVAVPIGVAGKTLGASKQKASILRGLDVMKERWGVESWSELKAADEKQKYWMQSSVPLDAIARVLDQSAEKLTQAKPEMAEIAKAFRRSISNEVVQTLKTRGFGNFAQRKGLFGYETDDVMKVTWDYFSGLYGSMTKGEAARKYTRALIEAKPRKADYELISQFIEDEMAPSTSLDRAVSRIRTFMFIKYIALNAKTAAVNVTNMLTTGVPVLSLHTSNAGAAVTRSAAAILQQKKADGGMRTRPGVFGNPEGENTLSEDRLRLQRELLTEGAIAHQQMNEMKGKLRDRYSWMSRVYDYMTRPMGITEWFSRASVADAAYQAAVEGRISNPKTLAQFGLVEGQKLDPKNEADFAKAKTFAEMVVEDSHGTFEKWNKPPLVRGSNPVSKLGSAFYTFKFFNQHVVEMATYMLNHEGKQGMLAAGRALFANVLLGGLLKGLPLASTLLLAYQHLTGGSDPEKDLNEAMPGHEGLVGAVMNGIPSLAGISIGSSIEISLPRSVDALLHGMLTGKMPGIDELGGDVSGVIGSSVEDLVRAASAQLSGQPRRAAEIMMPLFVRNLMQAQREATEGKSTLSGRAIALPGESEPYTLTAGEAVAKSLGFRSVRDERVTRLNDALRRSGEIMSGKKKSLADRYANALEAGDDAKTAAIIDELAAWNIMQAARGTDDLAIGWQEFSGMVKERLKPAQPSKRRLGRAMELSEGLRLAQ